MVLVLAMVCEAADGAILPFCWADIGDLAVPLAFFAIVAEYLAGGDGSQSRRGSLRRGVLIISMISSAGEAATLGSSSLCFWRLLASQHETRARGNKEGQGQSFTAGRDCRGFEEVVVVVVVMEV